MQKGLAHTVNKNFNDYVEKVENNKAELCPVHPPTPTP